MKLNRWVAVFAFLAQQSAQAFFADVGPLLQLVAGQVQEIEKLSDTLGLMKEQKDALMNLNAGIGRAVSQIESIQTIIQNSKNLDPRSIRSISELNEYLSRAKEAKGRVEDVLKLKILASDVAIESAAKQSQFSYTMGQEMIKVGSALALESKTASPGRAAQITAASSSAQMLSHGTLLQSLSQISQLQALMLDLEKTKIQQSLIDRDQENQAVLLMLKKRASKQTAKQSSLQPGALK